MATFLVTGRMAPELAARVEASVRGRRGGQSRMASPFGSTSFASRFLPSRARVVSLVRLGVAFGVAAVVVVLVLRARRKRDEFEGAKASVAETVKAVSAPLTEADLGAEARIESWLTRAAIGYEGDVVDDSLRAPGALDSVLAKGAVYVRGTAYELRSAGGIEQAASTSVKDPFLRCLYAPPSARTERAILEKVHKAYAGDAEPRVAGVRRLRDVQVGLPFLTAAWQAKVESASSWEELHVLRRALDGAPVASAALGLKAGLLVFAVDEPGDVKGPTELDGERPHPVRVGLVDLASSKVLLRLRKPVDPSGFSAEKRPLYAAGD